VIEENYKEWFSEVSFVKNERTKERTDWQAAGIIANKKKMRDRRSDETIYRNTWDSMVCEIGISDLIPTSYLNLQEFNYKDPSTHAWDVYEKTLEDHLEIKWMSTGSTWWTFTTGLWTKIKKNLLRGYPDKIVVATHIAQPELDGSTVYPRMVINPHTFDNYIRESKYDNYKPFYYDHLRALSDGECLTFNSEIVENNRLQNT